MISDGIQCWKTIINLDGNMMENVSISQNLFLLVIACSKDSPKKKNNNNKHFCIEGTFN